MKNRINRAVEIYNNKFGQLGSCKGAFYCSDFEDIDNIAKNGHTNDYKFNLISTALKAGFIIGYRRGKFESRQ